MNESEVMGILTSYNDVFQLNTMPEYIMRFFLWGLIKILVFLSNSIEGFFDAALSLNGFFASEGINKIFTKLSPIIWAFLSLSIIYIGYKIMFDREFKKEKAFQNTILALCTIVLLPTLMIQLSNITISSVKALDGIDNNKVKLSANKIIKDNMYDLYYLDSFKFSGKNLRNNINEKDIDYIDIHETIDESKVKNKDVFLNRISTDVNSKKELKALDNGFFDVIKEKYYRFNLDYMVVITTLLCNTAVMLFASIKIVKLFLELAVGKLLALLMATSDIGNGQKTKEVIKYLVNIFAVIFSIALMMKIYLLFSVYIESKNFPTMYNVILLCIGAWFVIDGANIIERILGIDAGVKDGHSFAMGAMALSKSVGATATTLSKISKEVGNKASKIGGFGVGTLSGAFSKGGKLEEDMKASKENGVENPNNESLASQMKNSDKSSKELKRNSSDSSTLNNDTKDNSSTNNDVNDSSTLNNDTKDSSANNDVKDNSSTNNDVNDYNNTESNIDDNVNTTPASYIQEEFNNSPIEQSSTNIDNIKDKSDMDDNKFPVDRNTNNNKYNNEKSNRPNHLGHQAHRVVDPSRYGLNADKSDGLKIENKEGMKNDSISKTETLGSQMKSALSNEHQSKNNLDNSKANPLPSNNINNSSKNASGIENRHIGQYVKDSSKNASGIENRHIGQYVKDSIRANPNVQATKKSFEVGKNTGESIKNRVKFDNPKENKINKIKKFTKSK